MREQKGYQDGNPKCLVNVVQVRVFFCHQLFQSSRLLIHCGDSCCILVVVLAHPTIEDVRFKGMGRTFMFSKPNVGNFHGLFYSKKEGE
jgi:hypothetical protein